MFIVFCQINNSFVVLLVFTIQRLYFVTNTSLELFVMKTIKALAELLVTERKKRNLSQKDMRMLIGMSQQQYQRIESGQDLKVSTLLRILAGLELELSITDPDQTAKKSAC